MRILQKSSLAFKEELFDKLKADENDREKILDLKSSEKPKSKKRKLESASISDSESGLKSENSEFCTNLDYENEKINDEKEQENEDVFVTNKMNFEEISKQYNNSKYGFLFFIPYIWFDLKIINTIFFI